jgi:dTMP kinase
MSGKIITIEGLDGSGKSTQIDLLLNYLSEKNIKHQYIHYPMLNQGKYGALIAEYLRGEFGEINQVHPKLVALLFAEDRKEHNHKILNWLQDDYLVVMDRYVNSNIAFQCAKTKTLEEKKALKHWILDFEFNHNQLPKPSQSVFLNVPFQYIEQSLKNQRTGNDRDYLNGKTDIHENDISFQKRVYEEYLNMLNEQDQLVALDCMTIDGNWLEKEKIHQKLIELFGI